MTQFAECGNSTAVPTEISKTKAQSVRLPESVAASLRSLRKTQIVSGPNLSKTKLHPKEQRLLEEIQSEIAAGRRCQVFVTYTGEHSMLHRLQRILQQAGIRAAVMESKVPTEKREAWYAERSKEGVQVCICHPKLVETGLDLLEFPTIYFYETGYSLHTLRQASRRSWRIGQHLPVRVKFFYYADTAQEKCVRHMGKKMLVSLMMEGKMSGEGLEDMDDGDDMVTAMVKELLEQGGVGESADDIWKSLERERKVYTDAVIATASSPTSAPTSEQVEAVLDRVAADSDLVPASAPTGVSEMAAEVLHYADSASGEIVLEQHGLAAFAAKRTNRRSEPVNQEQLSLF